MRCLVFAFILFQDVKLCRPVRKRQAQPGHVGIAGEQLCFDRRDLAVAASDSCRLRSTLDGYFLEGAGAYLRAEDDHASGGSVGLGGPRNIRFVRVRQTNFSNGSQRV